MRGQIVASCLCIFVLIVVLRFTAGSRIRDVRKFADRMVAMSPIYIQKHLKSGMFDEYVTPEAGEVLDRCAVIHNEYVQAIFSGSALPDRFVEPDDIKPLSQAMRALMEAGLCRVQPALMFKTPLQPADIEPLRKVERNMGLI